MSIRVNIIGRNREVIAYRDDDPERESPWLDPFGGYFSDSEQASLTRFMRGEADEVRINGRNKTARVTLEGL